MANTRRGLTSHDLIERAEQLPCGCLRPDRDVVYIERKQFKVRRLIMDAPSGSYVAHECASPDLCELGAGRQGCVNADHLTVLSHSEFAAWRHKVGQLEGVNGYNRRAGVKVDRFSIPVQHQHEIRHLRAHGESQKELAARYDASESAISRMINCIAWHA